MSPFFPPMLYTFIKRPISVLSENDKRRKKKEKIIKKNIYVYVYIRKRYIYIYIYTYKTSVCLNFVNVGPTYCQLSVTNRQRNEKKKTKK